MTAVFREVRRVLGDDGTLRLNLGDSYVGYAGGDQGKNGRQSSHPFTARVQPWRLSLNALRAASTFAWFFSAHFHTPQNASPKLFPSGVRA